MQSPEIKKKKGISPIWILPVIALVIGGWLLFKGMRDAGIDIVVHFESAEGIKVGKTQVMYRGIPVGLVMGKDIQPGLNYVALQIEMDKKTKEGLVEDLKFWIVRPEVSAGRISALGTLLSGSYIAVQKGASKVASRDFKGLEEAPGLPENAPGLHFKLKSKVLDSIQRGTQIYYKNIVIGKVQGYSLIADECVEIDAHIDPEFAHLIKTGTRFWNSSGITVYGGLSGFKVRVESAASLIYGGISMYTPEQKKDSPQVDNGHIFCLYKDYDAAEYGIKMTLRLPSAIGLSKGVSQVMYRGFKAGVVTDFTFNTDDPKKSVTAHILIEPEAEWILREETEFWVVEPQLSINRVEHLDTILKGSHITFKPGNGEFHDTFVAVEQPIEDEILRPGKKFLLVSENSKSFSVGAPVVYREIQVGEVVTYDLTADGEHVKAKIFIYEKYAGLVRKDYVFWKDGGIKIKAGLDGVSIETGTMTSLIAGGVTFENPDSGNRKIMAAKANSSFTLYESHHDATEAVSALQPKGLNVHVRAESSKSFSAGSPLLYKHIEVGEITEVRLAENNNDIILDLFIKENFVHLLKKTSRFYNVSGITVEGGLPGFEVKTGSVRSILKGGISFFTPVEGTPADEKTTFILYDDYQSALDEDKTEIVLHFAEPEGLKEGVDVTYQGVTIGDVTEVKYSQDLQSVVVKAFVDEGMEKLFCDDSLVWLVTAEVSLFGVKNLDTLIKGPHIAVLPGQGTLVLELKALAGPPSMLAEVRGGLNIVLESPALGSLKPNSPVYYRQVRVGRVMDFALSPKAREVHIFVNIEEPYAALIHENTVFWNASGINVDAGIFRGLHIYTESMEAIIGGGIAFATPEDKKMGPPANQGHHFVLQDKMDKDWLDWKPEIKLVEQ